jgi:hypothetical protein
VRHVGLTQSESLFAQVLTQPVPDLLTAQATSTNQFNGTGLTWGLQCYEPCCQGCFGDIGLFCSGRGSVIFGPNASAVSSTAQVGGAGIFAVSNNQANASQDNTLLMGELQAGLQWNRYLPCWYNRRVFVRGAFEYQYWGLANGLQTSTGSFAGRNPFDRLTITADQRNLSSINFVGFTIGAGCFW